MQVNRYDPEGLRYEMEENGRLVRFIFNPNREVVVEDNGKTITRLIRAAELIAGSTDSDSARTYYHYASDEMGSTAHLVDEAGKVQNRYEYDAWGNLTKCEETIPNRFTYYGQQWDPITQQYYLRARFYNPVIGLFTQEDTYRGDGLNLYAYCANNPVYYVDPSGYDKDPLNTLWDQKLEQLAKTNSHAQSEIWYRQGLLHQGKNGQWYMKGHRGVVSTPLSQMTSTGQHYLHRPYLHKGVVNALENNGRIEVGGYIYGTGIRSMMAMYQGRLKLDTCRVMNLPT